MEDKGNNPGGSGGPRSFGKVPLSAYLRCLDADELGQALAKIRDCDAWWGGEMLPHLHGFDLRPQ